MSEQEEKSIMASEQTGQGNGANGKATLKNGKKTVIIVTVIAAVLVIAAIVGVIMYNNMPEQKLKKQLSLGDKYLSELNYEEAILAYDAALRIEPNNSAVTEKEVNAYKAWASSEFNSGNYEHTVVILEEGYEKLTDDNLYDQVIETYIDWSMVSYSEGDLDNAIDVIEQADDKYNDGRIDKKINEYRIEKLFKEAESYIQDKEYIKAIETIDKIIDMDESNTEALDMWVVTQIERADEAHDRGEIDEALLIVINAYEEYPDERLAEKKSEYESEINAGETEPEEETEEAAETAPDETNVGETIADAANAVENQEDTITDASNAVENQADTLVTEDTTTSQAPVAGSEMYVLFAGQYRPAGLVGPVENNPSFGGYYYKVGDSYVPAE